MFRRIAASMVVASMAALGIAVTAPGTAMAVEDDIYCTSTNPPDQPVFDKQNPGQLLGWRVRSYVGSGSATQGRTWRVWHVTGVPVGGTPHYEGAFAVRCRSDGSSDGELDLSKTVAVGGNPPICGTTDFIQGTTYYDFLGSRFNDGDKFRYWATTTSGGSFFGLGVAAQRCD